MDTEGGKPQWSGDGGVLNWAIGIDMYTLMCIKLMTNKNLLYKKNAVDIIPFLWVKKMSNKNSWSCLHLKKKKKLVLSSNNCISF